MKLLNFAMLSASLQVNQRIYRIWKAISNGVLINGWKNMPILRLVWLPRCQTLRRWKYKKRITLYKPVSDLLAGFSLCPYVSIFPDIICAVYVH